MWSRRSAELAEVLAACGLDQPVEGVVGVFGARLDAGVAEEDGLLGVIRDVGDVADGVVGVPQVLELAARPAGDRRLRAVVGECRGVTLGGQPSSGGR